MGVGHQEYERIATHEAYTPFSEARGYFSFANCVRSTTRRERWEGPKRSPWEAGWRFLDPSSRTVVQTCVPNPSECSPRGPRSLRTRLNASAQVVVLQGEGSDV